MGYGFTARKRIIVRKATRLVTSTGTALRGWW